MTKRTFGGIALALISASVFGSGGAFVPPLLETGWSAGAISFVRTAAAAALLLVPTLIALRDRWGDVRRQGWRVAAYGALAIAGTQFAYYQALGRIPVGTALMIEYLAPVLLVAFVAVQRRRLPAPSVLVGSALAIGGLALVLDLTGHMSVDVIGVLFALAAAVLCASYFALSASIELPPVGLAGLGMIGASASTGTFALLGLIPMSVGSGAVVMGGTELSPLVPLALIVVSATVVAYLTGIAAARMLGGRRASFLSLSEVLAAVIAAALLLGQMPSFIQVVGAVVLLSGIVLVLRDGDENTGPAVDSGEVDEAESSQTRTEPAGVLPV